LGSQNVTIQTYNIGIGLNVRARINDDGNVTLRLNPIIQSLTGITNGLPQTSSREANTTVMIKDGESVVIGGLIRDQDTRTVQEVPFFSKLPFVGQLFRHTDRDHLKSNVIVTVTPHIVQDSPGTPK
jgi:type II secretory pathway component GspD/PulD (secretin)